MDLVAQIDALWEAGELDAGPIEQAIRLLDQGDVRVADRGSDGWHVNEWTKKAILLYFRLRKVEPMEVGGLHFLDKIPVKSDYAERGVRVVPPGVARYGSYLSEGVVLMPGFVNIGAWVGPRTMVDTWATVGSCAQIGADVHLAGGVGIGGVLEPPQARPVIVVPGTRPKEFPAGTFHLACALIIGWRGESTDLKVSLNDALREYGIGSG